MQFLDAATGRVLRQTPFPATDWLTNFSRVTQNDRNAFITNGSANGANLVITAYNMETGQILFRQPFEGSINNAQATGKTLLLSTDAVSTLEQPDRRIESQIVALDSQNGRLLWRRSNSQMQCYGYASTWQADSQWVYLNCNRPGHGFRGSSTIVALSTQTGEIRWQTVINPNHHSDDIPIAINERQLLTLRQINQGDTLQTQAIALDRQTGTVLWTHALFDTRARFFRSRLAANGNQFFLMDEIPRWQLWLLQMNRHWYLKRSITVEKN